MIVANKRNTCRLQRLVIRFVCGCSVFSMSGGKKRAYFRFQWGNCPLNPPPSLLLLGAEVPAHQQCDIVCDLCVLPPPFYSLSCAAWKARLALLEQAGWALVYCVIWGSVSPRVPVQRSEKVCCVEIVACVMLCWVCAADTCNVYLLHHSQGQETAGASCETCVR